MIYLSVKITEMIYNLSGNVVNDAKMLMWCQTTHLYKLTVHFFHCINRGNILTRSQLGRYYFRKNLKKHSVRVHYRQKKSVGWGSVMDQSIILQSFSTGISPLGTLSTPAFLYCEID